MSAMAERTCVSDPARDLFDIKDDDALWLNTLFQCLPDFIEGPTTSGEKFSEMLKNQERTFKATRKREKSNTSCQKDTSQLNVFEKSDNTAWIMLLDSLVQQRDATLLGTRSISDREDHTESEEEVSTEGLLFQCAQEQFENVEIGLFKTFPHITFLERPNTAFSLTKSASRSSKDTKSTPLILEVSLSNKTLVSFLEKVLAKHNDAKTEYEEFETRTSTSQNACENTMFLISVLTGIVMSVPPDMICVVTTRYLSKNTFSEGFPPTVLVLDGANQGPLYLSFYITNMRARLLVSAKNCLHKFDRDDMKIHFEFNFFKSCTSNTSISKSLGPYSKEIGSLFIGQPLPRSGKLTKDSRTCSLQLTNWKSIDHIKNIKCVDDFFAYALCPEIHLPKTACATIENDAVKNQNSKVECEGRRSNEFLELVPHSVSNPDEQRVHNEPSNCCEVRFGTGVSFVLSDWNSCLPGSDGTTRQTLILKPRLRFFLDSNIQYTPSLCSVALQSVDTSIGQSIEPSQLDMSKESNNDVEQTLSNSSTFNIACWIPLKKIQTQCQRAVGSANENPSANHKNMKSLCFTTLGCCVNENVNIVFIADRAATREDKESVTSESDTELDFEPGEDASNTQDISFTFVNPKPGLNGFVAALLGNQIYKSILEVSRQRCILQNQLLDIEEHVDELVSEKADILLGETSPESPTMRSLLDSSEEGTAQKSYLVPGDMSCSKLELLIQKRIQKAFLYAMVMDKNQGNRVASVDEIKFTDKQLKEISARKSLVDVEEVVAGFSSHTKFNPEDEHWLLTIAPILNDVRKPFDQSYAQILAAHTHFKVRIKREIEERFQKLAEKYLETVEETHPDSITGFGKKPLKTEGKRKFLEEDKMVPSTSDHVERDFEKQSKRLKR